MLKKHHNPSKEINAFSEIGITPNVQVLMVLVIPTVRRLHTNNMDFPCIRIRMDDQQWENCFICPKMVAFASIPPQIASIWGHVILIRVILWRVKVIARALYHIDVNLWDFAGQDRYFEGGMRKAKDCDLSWEKEKEKRREEEIRRRCLKVQKNHPTFEISKSCILIFFLS